MLFTATFEITPTGIFGLPEGTRTIYRFLSCTTAIDTSRHKSVRASGRWHGDRCQSTDNPMPNLMKL
jgi:hypothetical protein